jgi:Ca2+/Na+ antiporter
MYLGYMKKGTQVMLMAAAVGLLGGVFMSMRIELFGALFYLLLPIIWFYQMFDAMHTAKRMKKHDIETPDDDGFIVPEGMVKFSPSQNRTVAKIVAGVLILVGSTTLIYGVLNNMRWSHFWSSSQAFHFIDNVIRNNLVPAVVSLALIIAGIKLLRGGRSKKTKDNNDKEGEV